MGYWYQDNSNPTLSHSARYTYDALNRLATAVATGSIVVWWPGNWREGGDGVITCPVCGWQFRREELSTERVRCPGCKEALRWPGPRHLKVKALASLVAAGLLPYLLGARGDALIGYGILV